MGRPIPKDAVAVPRRYPTSLIFLDESGSKATGSRLFVIGAIKLREPGRFARALQDVRDRHEFRANSSSTRSRGERSRSTTT
jgi:hypothetical protein